MEEERRLFYVAITRAEKRLFLSFATTRFKWGQFIDCSASRFISEVNTHLVEKQQFTLKKKEYNQHNIYAKTKLKHLPLREKKFVTHKNLANISRTKNNTINVSGLSNIRNGMKVKHGKFGEGKIINLSGEGSNKKATVFFNGIGQKKLLLKFAKLEIIT